VATQRTNSLPPALLVDATWYGTLAAARNLSKHGVSITLACDAFVAPARFSRHVTQTVSCPSSKNAIRLLAWLRSFGKEHPGHVLYPTSDGVAWLISAHAEELSRWYYLYSPPLESLVRLLDKARLVADARAAGLDVPETLVPENDTEVEQAGQRLGFPLFIKPRSQVFGVDLGKGVRVERASELVGVWRTQRDTAQYSDKILDLIPNLSLPLVQASCGTTERIYTVDGFVNEKGDAYATLACVKLLQRPRRSGAGIIFERAEIDPSIHDGLRRLFKRTGFYGVFDAEFIESEGRKLLIDINPRFYNHMAFEVDLGLHFPWLVYLGATGNREALRDALDQSLAVTLGPRAYVHGIATTLMLRAQALTQAMPAEDRLRWRRWIAENNGYVTDPTRSAEDPLPALAEVVMELVSFAHHPRSYLRNLARS